MPRRRILVTIYVHDVYNSVIIPAVHFVLLQTDRALNIGLSGSIHPASVIRCELSIQTQKAPPTRFVYRIPPGFSLSFMPVVTIPFPLFVVTRSALVRSSSICLVLFALLLCYPPLLVRKPHSSRYIYRTPLAKIPFEYLS